jgi:selenophosphate synthase
VTLCCCESWRIIEKWFEIIRSYDNTGYSTICEGFAKRECQECIINNDGEYSKIDNVESKRGRSVTGYIQRIDENSLSAQVVQLISPEREEERH